MPTLTVNNEQVMDLVKQLPLDQQHALLQFLLAQHWATWVELARAGEVGVRAAAAQRGRAWETMTEDEREAFIDDLVHEDR